MSAPADKEADVDPFEGLPDRPATYQEVGEPRVPNQTPAHGADAPAGVAATRQGRPSRLARVSGHVQQANAVAAAAAATTPAAGLSLEAAPFPYIAD